MTKKHFEAFAREIASLVRDGLREEGRLHADFVCGIASQFNPRFDRDRFLKACGLG